MLDLFENGDTHVHKEFRPIILRQQFTPHFDEVFLLECVGKEREDPVN